jgi:hypothetical protein
MGLLQTWPSEGVRPTRALPRDARLWDERGLLDVFRSTGKHVLTFLGFGELGYEDEREFHTTVARELATYAPANTIVNTGTLVTVGFRRGIADVYELAKRMGFSTTGVHPSIALSSPKRHALSGWVDEVYFVRDESWGGLLRETAAPSPTLRALIAVTHDVVVIGGGKHTAEEMQAFSSCEKQPRFYPMDMHHATSRGWASESGIDVGDFRGAAYHAWISRGERLTS